MQIPFLNLVAFGMMSNSLGRRDLQSSVARQCCAQRVLSKAKSHDEE